MGDSGSLAIGASLGGIALISNHLWSLLIIASFILGMSSLSSYFVWFVSTKGDGELLVVSSWNGADPGSIEDLDNKRIMSLLKRASELLPIAKGRKKSDILKGKILSTCFFEAFMM